MAFTHEEWLPSFAELEVPEITMTAAPLRASARQFGMYCDHQSKEFMLCKKEEKDPRKCLNEGKEVTRCGVEFFNKLRKHCASEFTTYWQCVDHSACDLRLDLCRKKQAVFDKCVLDQLGQELPEIGHFSKVRVHHTTRPKPKRDIPMPDEIPGSPDPYSVPEPDSVKHGIRFFNL